MPPDFITITPSILYFGTPVVLVVTRNPDGSANITPISSAWALGSRIVVGLGMVGQGIANLQRERECTLNLPSADSWKKVESIARTTGLSPVPDDKARAGYGHEPDKFSLGGFTPRASDIVRPPRIAECPLQLEAWLMATHRCAPDRSGTKAPPYFIVDLDVVRVHARRDLVTAGTNHIDTGRWNPLFYVFRHYFGDATDLGSNFRAEA